MNCPLYARVAGSKRPIWSLLGATSALPVTRETHPKQAEPAPGKTHKLLNNMNCREFAPRRCRTHNPKVEGSNPSPATKPHQENLRAAKEILPAVAIYSNFACPADELEITE